MGVWLPLGWWVPSRLGQGWSCGRGWRVVGGCKGSPSQHSPLSFTLTRGMCAPVVVVLVEEGGACRAERWAQGGGGLGECMPRGPLRASQPTSRVLRQGWGCTHVHMDGPQHKTSLSSARTLSSECNSVIGRVCVGMWRAKLPVGARQHQGTRMYRWHRVSDSVPVRLGPGGEREYGGEGSGGPWCS
jgi:hypothetical protein